MYFPFFKLKTEDKRSAAQPPTIYSEFPYIMISRFAENFLER